jgi:oligoribonuclease NrnB/cAMP/cGMP phosphodiesterase (DHH superfamily)
VNAIICTHEADLDGICSAAIGLLKYKNASINFYNYGKENFKTMFEMLVEESKRISEGIIIVSDLGINLDVVTPTIDSIKKIKETKWQMFWVDHHLWPIEANPVSSLVSTIHDFSGTKCASDLMYEYFMPLSSTAQDLSLIAHTSDFMSNDVYVPPIPELIQYYRTFSNAIERLLVLTYKIAKGIFWDVEMQQEYIEYSKIRKRKHKEALKTMIMRKICGYDVALVMTSKYLQSSIFANEIMKETSADLVFLIDTCGKVSIRRSNLSISCQRIAHFLNEGGGHSFAAGARLTSNMDKWENCLEELEIALRKSLDSK